MKRRNFLHRVFSMAGLLVLPLPYTFKKEVKSIVTVTGKILPDKLGTTLVHEHIMVDFIGADQVNSERYQTDEVYQKVLPYLKEVKKLGCDSLIECTPAYLGRDVKLLRKLSEASGVQIITNTGYYGAVQSKYLPAHAFEEDAGIIASHWIREWEDGIENTGIFPGFIKTGVDGGSLSAVNQKMLMAAAITHLKTGLTISAHTGDGTAAFEEIEILKQQGVSPEAFRWVHAQNEKDIKLHAKAAAMGAWVEFDGISPDSITEHVAFVNALKKQGFLNRVLISHDAGWYHVGEEQGGIFRPFNAIHKIFIPSLKKEGFKEKDIHQLLVKNPMESFRIKVRKFK